MPAGATLDACGISDFRENMSSKEFIWNTLAFLDALISLENRQISKPIFNSDQALKVGIFSYPKCYCSTKNEKLMVD